MSLTIRRKKGSPFWYARGSIPARQPDGTVVNVPIDRSTKETRKAEAARAADRLWHYYNEQAYHPKPKSVSFTDAAITYVETKNPSKRERQFIAKLVAHFGETPIAEIDQSRVSNAAWALYSGRSAATHSRAVFAPVNAICRLSGVRLSLERPKGRRTERKVPTEEWFDAVIPLCPPRLAALLVFLTLTGRRVSEAIALTEKNLDGTTVSISRTKTGVPVTLEMPSLVSDLLAAAERDFQGGPGERPSKQLFGYSTKDNAHRALRRICDLHGLPYYSSHAFGRHAFATRLLKQGWSVKHVARAGGWKSPMMVLKHYGHLEQDEVQEGVKKVGKAWSLGRKRAIGGKTLKKRPKTAKK